MDHLSRARSGGAVGTPASEGELMLRHARGFVAVSGSGFAVPGPGHPEEAACPRPSINCRRRFRTVDRINKRQVYRGYRVAEVVNSFPEHSDNPIPHKAYHHCAVRMHQNTVLKVHYPGLASAVLIN
jgi:hypothetical protein